MTADSLHVLRLGQIVLWILVVGNTFDIHPFGLSLLIIESLLSVKIRVWQSHIDMLFFIDQIKWQFWWLWNLPHWIGRQLWVHLAWLLSLGYHASNWHASMAGSRVASLITHLITDLIAHLIISLAIVCDAVLGIGMIGDWSTAVRCIDILRHLLNCRVTFSIRWYWMVINVSLHCWVLNLVLLLDLLLLRSRLHSIVAYRWDIFWFLGCERPSLICNWDLNSDVKTRVRR